jgi:3-deoxy-7-phosphoheptulonate synthase
MAVPTTIPTLTDLHAHGAAQQPTYPDARAVDDVVAELRQRPPLVFAGEADELKARLADVARARVPAAGRRLRRDLRQRDRRQHPQRAARAALDGGRAAVRGAGARGEGRTHRRPVRQAAQQRRPRPATASRCPVLPRRRRERLDFTPEARVHDPRRLLDVYNSSAATLNLVRAFVNGGFADLRTVHSWNSDFVRTRNVEEKYDPARDEIERAMAFMVACGVSDDSLRHRRLLGLARGAADGVRARLTRIDSRTGTPYGTSGHLLWIGERTRQLDGAHVELLAACATRSASSSAPPRPPTTRARWSSGSTPTPSPDASRSSPGWAPARSATRCPPLIEAVEATGRKVAWVCDPMHGNTYSTERGYKTRAFPVIWDEVDGFFDVHAELGTWPGGVHIELTGNDVTECVGGVDELDEADLADRYETACDPR